MVEKMFGISEGPNPIFDAHKINWEEIKETQVGEKTKGLHNGDYIHLRYDDAPARFVVGVDSRGRIRLRKRVRVVINAPVKVFCPHIF